MKADATTYRFTCIECGDYEDVLMSPSDYEKWKGGELIQRVFPHFSDNTRELMISQVCGKCFDEIVPNE